MARHQTWDADGHLVEDREVPDEPRDTREAAIRAGLPAAARRLVEIQRMDPALLPPQLRPLLRAVQDMARVVRHGLVLGDDPALLDDPDAAA